MKLVIQIPCFNEEETIRAVLASTPKAIPGIGCIETLVIDDGSTDRTVINAIIGGATHVYQLKKRHGLARAFLRGLSRSLALGADLIVNLDGDNQYEAKDIPLLLEPILREEAELVIGARPLKTLPVPFRKALFYKVGEVSVRWMTGLRITDPTSGFRAYSASLASRLWLLRQYTYTLETLAQASYEGAEVREVPIRARPVTRPSRLIRSMPDYIFRNGSALARRCWWYERRRLLGSAKSLPDRFGEPVKGELAPI